MNWFRILLIATMFLASANLAEAKTLRWSSVSDMATLDPYAHNETFTNNLHLHIYDSLVARGRSMKIQPALATSWEKVAATRWRFKLREGVTFHEGQPFDASDVVVSVKRMRDPNSRGASNLPHVIKAEQVDAYTVDIVLDGPYPLLLNDLANFPIMSGRWLKEHNALEPGNIAKEITNYASTHANGTGPFKVVSYQRDVGTVFAVNDKWWQNKQHNIDRIEFRPIKSDATRVSALMSGELELIAPAPLQDIARIDAHPDLQVKQDPSLRLIFLGLNWRPELHAMPGKKNPLLDVKVRRALWHAIDIDTIKNKIMRGKAKPTGTVVAPQIAGFDPELDKPFGYDPERAKALLAEAGYPDGFTVGLACPNNRYIADEQLCLAVGSMWTKVGVDAKVKSEPRAVFFPRVDRGETDIYLYGWANLPTMDASSILSVVLSSRTDTMGGNNPNGLSNPEVDKISRAIAVELDEPKRLAMIRKALSTVREEVLIIPLHFQPVAWGMSKKLDLPQFPDEYVRLWFANLK